MRTVGMGLYGGTPGVVRGHNIRNNLIWKNAIASSMGAVAKLVVIGDSISAPSNEAIGYVTLLRNYLQNVYGDAGYGLFGAYRSNWAFSSGWVDVGWGIASGLKQTGTSGETASITMNGDSADIYWIRSASSAAFMVSVDGGDLISYGSSGSVLEIASHIDLGQVGEHSLIVTTGGTTSLDAVLVSNGSSGIQVHNCAKIGANTTTYTNNAFNLLWVDVVRPHLTIISLGTNDYGNQIALSAFETNISTIVDKCKLYGDVFILAQCNSNTNLTIPQSQYAQIQRKIAISKNCGFFDVGEAWGTWDQANSMGYMADNLHPSALGHANIFSLISSYFI